MKNLVITLIVCVIALTGASHCPADISSNEVNSLKGLPGVMVVVEDLPPDVEKAGLARDLLVTDVELRLKQAGVAILTDGPEATKAGLPFLYVNVQSHTNVVSIDYAAHVSVCQSVYLARDPKLFVVGVKTWDHAFQGRGPADYARNDVRDLVDRFLNDFLKANPKKESPSP